MEIKKILLSWLLVWGTLWAQGPRAMIIFDASGSMWGQIDGVNKIVIARDALRSVLERWNPKVRLGLTVYGHRVKGDCNDIETLIPIGPVDKKRMIETVEGILPKGKTPISRSLRKVAEQLRAGEDRATIILISDGKETCDADPCKTAKALKESGIDFVAHVIGFNVDRNTDRQLACIARVTGGEYFSAQNAAALNRAMRTIVKKVERPKPRKPVKASIDLHARYDLAMRGRDLPGVAWEIRQGGKRLYKGTQISPRVSTKPGVIRIRAEYRNGPVPQTVEGQLKLPAGKNLPVIIPIKSAELTLSAAEEEGGPEVKAALTLTPEAGEGSEAKTRYCTARPGKPCRMILPVGSYEILAKYNGMEARKKVTLEDKERRKVQLHFRQTGWVETSASESEGGPWVDAKHEVDAADGSGVGCTPWSGKKEPGKCRLPVGKYILKSRYNKFEKKKTPFVIEPGKTTKIHVVFGQTGWVETSASESEGGPWVDAKHEVDAADGSGVGCAPWSGKKKPGKCRLPVGKYIVKSRYKGFRKETPLTIEPGKTAKVHVVFDTLTIRLECPRSDRRFALEIYASDGRQLFETEGRCGGSYRVVLDPGSYRLYLTEGEKRIERRFEIAPGGPRELKIDPGIAETAGAGASEASSASGKARPPAPGDLPSPEEVRSMVEKTREVMKALEGLQR